MARPTPTSWIRSLDKETVKAVEGVVKGSIPNWVNGLLIRNGSGVNELGGVKFNHLFDGFSVLHRFAITDGKATYQNRLLKSNTYVQSMEKQRLMTSQFGTVSFPDPCQSLLGRFMSRFTPLKLREMTDNCAVNVAFYNDALYAMTETNTIHRVDPDTLETIPDKKVAISKIVAVNAATAHPHVGKDGTVYNLGNTFRGGSGLSYHIIQFPAVAQERDDMKPFQQASVVASVQSRWKAHPAYMHSFGITENYFVLLETPLVLNLLKMATMKLSGLSYKECMEWYDKENTKIVLVERSTGRVVPVTYEAPAMFAFHFINCYEQNGQLVADVCAVKNGLKLVDDLSIQALSDNTNEFENSYPTRIVLPLNVQDAPNDENLITLEGSQCKAFKRNDIIFCEHETLSDLPMELPRINYKLNGERYRYCYGMGIHKKMAEPCRLVKLDLVTKETLIWEKAGFSVSEPVFVARPESQSEDDGVILAAVMDDENHCKVSLLVLDAADFKELAMVEFQTEGVIPHTFHGIFAGHGETFHAY